MFIFLEYQKQKEEYGDCLKEGLKRLISLKESWEKVGKITEERSPFYASGWGQFNLMVDGYEDFFNPPHGIYIYSGISDSHQYPLNSRYE